uniref:Tumor protein p53-inducible protein 11 n=1 Tax=Syphacia muris TaxID=451379 RepID=A0A0N5AYF7_9BILA
MQQSSECDVARKQSASDLQSRLKTRKLLGVGELVGDNGDIYRSKISQLLGINESLYVKLPKGLLLFNSLITLYIYVTGILCILIPSVGSKLEFESYTGEYSGIRFYGAALAAFGILFRSLLTHLDTRSEIATFLSSCSVLFFLQIAVTTLEGQISFIRGMFRAAMILGCIYYKIMLDKQGSIYRYLARSFEGWNLFGSSTCGSPAEEKDKKA